MGVLLKNNTSFFIFANIILNFMGVLNAFFVLGIYLYYFNIKMSVNRTSFVTHIF